MLTRRGTDAILATNIAAVPARYVVAGPTCPFNREPGPTELDRQNHARRYRAQSKLPHLENQLAELEARLSALRTEREQNKQRLAALSERVASKLPQRPAEQSRHDAAPSGSSAERAVTSQVPLQVSGKTWRQAKHHAR